MTNNVRCPFFLLLEGNSLLRVIYHCCFVNFKIIHFIPNCIPEGSKFTTVSVTLKLEVRMFVRPDALTRGHEQRFVLIAYCLNRNQHIKFCYKNRWYKSCLILTYFTPQKSGSAGRTVM